MTNRAEQAERHIGESLMRSLRGESREKIVKVLLLHAMRQPADKAISAKLSLEIAYDLGAGRPLPSPEERSKIIDDLTKTKCTCGANSTNESEVMPSDRSSDQPADHTTSSAVGRGAPSGPEETSARKTKDNSAAVSNWGASGYIAVLPKETIAVAGSDWAEHWEEALVKLRHALKYIGANYGGTLAHHILSVAVAEVEAAALLRSSVPQAGAPLTPDAEPEFINWWKGNWPDICPTHQALWSYRWGLEQSANALREKEQEIERGKQFASQLESNIKFLNERVAKSEAENAALRKENDRLADAWMCDETIGVTNGKPDGGLRPHIRKTIERAENAEARVQKLEDGLREYAVHHGTCAAIALNAAPDIKCTCGLSRLLASDGGRG